MVDGVPSSFQAIIIEDSGLSDIPLYLERGRTFRIALHDLSQSSLRPLSPSHRSATVQDRVLVARLHPLFDKSHENSQYSLDAADSLTMSRTFMFHDH